MTPHDPSSSGHLHQPERASTTARDPVCGMQVAPDTPHRLDHQGTTYFFCCAGCQRKFAADPGRYLGAVRTPAAR